MNQLYLCYLFNLNQSNIISYCRLNKFLLNQHITWEQIVQPTYVRSIRHNICVLYLITVCDVMCVLDCAACVVSVFIRSSFF